jgi:hypothetical protein
MAFVHGKDTYFSLNASDLSAFTTTSELERTADKHDVTTYGKDDHVYSGGLGDGSASAEGIYDNTTSGPRDIIEPLIGTVVQLIRRPEGTGSGLPEDQVDVLVEKYKETNPVADMVKWSVDLQLSDAVVSTNQT